VQGSREKCESGIVVTGISSWIFNDAVNMEIIYRYTRVKDFTDS
jgi:hypothetical protein